MVIHVAHSYFNIIAAFTRILRNSRKKKKLVNVPTELREPNFLETYSSLWEAVKGVHMFATVFRTVWQASSKELGLSTVVDIVFLELIEIMCEKKKRKIICFLSMSEVKPYGTYMAKIDLASRERLEAELVREHGANPPLGKYVIVSGTTPTRFGEGKTTVTMGLAQALGAHRGRPTFACIRQPSQGPTFGIKGGAAGGGYAQVIPMEDFNLHMTGDMHAVTAAHNLLSAAIDSRILHESKQSDAALLRRMCPPAGKGDGGRDVAPPHARRLERLGFGDIDSLSREQLRRFIRLDVDPNRVYWRRVLDTSDRLLRNFAIGESADTMRQTGFDITAASEVMAILALSTSLADMRARLERIIPAFDRRGEPLTAEDFGVVGAMLVLLKEAVHPTLMQTIEGTPVFVHAGPFANIAHGSSSVVADQIALRAVGPDGFVVTEGGFGSDVGLEKFADIKCRSSGLRPDAVVLTTTLRAVRSHSMLDADDASIEPMRHVDSGAANLGKHVENAHAFGLPVVVAINRFAGDDDDELAALSRIATERYGARAAVVASHWSHGGAGALALADAVDEACSSGAADFKLLYDVDNTTMEQRIETVAKRMYGAAGVEFSPLATQKLDFFRKIGLNRLPVCMAKTPLSLSHDPSLKGVPTDFVVPIKNIRASAGAGFLYVLAGEIQTMPGQPTRPNFLNVYIDDEGQIQGLS
jgi:formyltetrahydrofolate synthetase